MNKKIIIGLIIISLIIILSGCVDSAPAQQSPASEISKTVHLIKSERLLNSYYDDYKVYHDDELNQTCTIFLFDRGAGLSCIADSK